jgi:hypothetical protein
MRSWQFKAAGLVFLGGWLGTCSLQAQDGSSQQPASAPQTSGQQTSSQELGPKPEDAAPAATQGNGKVLFSRSDEDDGSAAVKAAAAVQPRSTDAAGHQLSARERDSLTFLAYELDVRLIPRQESLAVRAWITVRNDGDRPLTRIALQLSSTLKWERIRIGDGDAKFAQRPLDSDADHTGTVNEAVVTLPRPLAPKDELNLEVFYSGLAALSGERLERIGAPNISAERSDWDRVSADFIGLRGFGNVVWYPVSAPPVLLGDGAKLFAEIGRQKERQQQARVSMTVTAEYSADAAPPNLAVLDGQVIPVVQTAAPENSYPGVVTATLSPTVLGFATPSLFLLNRQKVDDGDLQIYAAAEDLASAQSYVTAVHVVTPMVQRWLGTKPKSSLTVVGLPDAEDLTAEEGAVFFTGFKASADLKEMESAMVHSLSHAYFRSPRVWLNEGVAQLLGSLWVEQVEGRHTALEALGASESALTLAEPGTPEQANGQDLIHASDVVYYRTKATYVLWMLRELVGDAQLAAALTAYSSADDTTPEYFERLLEKASGKDLKWFFDDWVYHDRGLPDFSIGGVFPSPAAATGQWLVALDISNDGYAEAEVPVTVRSKDATVTERLRISAKGKVSRRVLIGGQPTQVQVNDGTVPEVRESEHVITLTGGAP